MDWDLRPARDLDLSFAKRLKSYRRERGLLGLAGNAMWLILVRAYLAAMHRLRVTGQANLPAEGPFVMVGNHTSHLDALSLTAALPWRLGTQAVALAAGNVFFKNTATSMFAATALNALPIWRKETTAEDLAFLRLRLLEDRMVFILFPEGTRSRNGEMGRFRPGLGSFVAGTAIPVVPCYLSGAHACWPPERVLPRPGRLHLTIGEKLLFENVANERDGWKDVATRAEAAVRALAKI